MAEQLTLPVDLAEDINFASFICQPSNQQLLAHLKLLAKANSSQQLTLLNADKGAGKSHLLQATFKAAQQQGLHSVFLALDTLVDYPAHILDGLENNQLICLDNIEAIVGHSEWERALFNLINQVKAASTSHLLMSANAGAKQLAFKLPDLRSRLAWGINYQLYPLSDDTKPQALTLRANLRGFNLPIEAANYLCVRAQRDMPSLIASLDQLSAQALQHKRKLTVPFVRQVLTSNQAG